MLIEFRVRNYRSFSNWASLSLLSSSTKEKAENLIESPTGAKALKAVLVYGANAAGKSNLISALDAAITIIRTSSRREPDAPMPHVEPFAFVGELDSASSFEFEFIAGGHRHIYGFSCTSRCVTEEHLVVYTSQRPTKVFSRSMDDYSFFSTATRKALEPLAARNTPNKLFLATAALWNAEVVEKAYSWLASSIGVHDPQQSQVRSLSAYENDADGSLRAFTRRLLYDCDLNIGDYEVRPIYLDKTSSGTSYRVKEYIVSTVHGIQLDEGSNVSFPLPIAKESKGTQNLFFLAPEIKHALDSGSVFCIDELDSSMHPDLLRHLIGLFNSDVTKPKGAQLIATLHSTEVLSLNLLGRDQVYFIDKDRKTGAYELYSLSDFPVRTSEDIRKAYLAGRFGAVPNIL